MHDPSVASRSRSAGDRSPGGTDESTLVLRAQDGDVLAFAVLLENYESSISALCLKILHHEAEAELIVQETFLTAWRRLDSLPDPESFHPWISEMAAHRSLFVLRNARDEHAAPPQPDQGHRAAAQAAAPEVPAQVRTSAAVLTRLPVEEHLAWLLHEVDGQSPAEIAEILQVTPERVRERIRRAHGALATRREG